MKKDYSTKKKAVIAVLSIVAVCLAGGLFYYTGTMGEQPQGGEKRSDGAIYVPGFGWVEDSGEENKTIIAPNAGTGEPVGDM